jgi:hypothetical protein
MMPNLTLLLKTSTKFLKLAESALKAIGLTSSAMPLRDKTLRTFSLFPEELLLPRFLTKTLDLELKPRPNKRNQKLLRKRRMLIWEVYSTNELYFIKFFI